MFNKALRMATRIALSQFATIEFIYGRKIACVFQLMNRLTGPLSVRF